MTEQQLDQRFAPIALWRVASRLMITLFNLFGEPQELAFRHTLVARDHKAALSWLRTVEALFRKLLLIEASYYAEEVVQQKQRAGSKRARRLVSFVPENPEAWRVSFRTNLECGRSRMHGAVVPMPLHGGRSSAAGEDARAPSLAPTTFHSAWPLAERFEALLRVHNNPAPYAKRLARRLYANAAPIAVIAKEPPELQNRIDPEPHAELVALFDVRALVFKTNTS